MEKIQNYSNNFESRKMEENGGKVSSAELRSVTGMIFDSGGGGGVNGCRPVNSNKTGTITQVNMPMLA